MLTVHAASLSATAPLDGLVVGELTEPELPLGWVRVKVVMSSLNHHDLWSLRGVGLPESRLPMILGCDGAGKLDDGSEVIIHSVIATPDWAGDETLDPKRSLLSEVHAGTFAEYVHVPARNVVAKPAAMSWENAAVLSTSWLTAYRMLFTQANVKPGDTVLVQGASGGVATAAIQLGAAAGLRMWVTSRDEAKLSYALKLGADAVFETGAKLPRRVDAVLETVGAATWKHSIKSLQSGGTLVIAGATTGDDIRPELTDIFFRQLRILGSTMGTRDELQSLISFVTDHAIQPAISEVMPLNQARKGFEIMLTGKQHGKIVFTH
ncbi:MAG: zinc-binding dehydrogenase [Propionibacteriaceae bacterium]